MGDHHSDENHVGKLASGRFDDWSVVVLDENDHDGECHEYSDDGDGDGDERGGLCPLDVLDVDLVAAGSEVFLGPPAQVAVLARVLVQKVLVPGARDADPATSDRVGLDLLGLAARTGTRAHGLRDGRVVRHETRQVGPVGPGRRGRRQRQGLLGPVDVRENLEVVRPVRQGDPGAHVDVLVVVGAPFLEVHDVVAAGRVAVLVELHRLVAPLEGDVHQVLQEERPVHRQHCRTEASDVGT